MIISRDPQERARELARSRLPQFVLRRLKPSYAPAPGRVAFGDLRRTRPFSTHFGADRGQPVDRYYIERFLAMHAADVRGRVLEVGDTRYTRSFGADRVMQSDVLHIDADAPGVTVVADLADADHVSADLFDCIIVTQTLQMIFDVSAAVVTLRRILAPGGVVLATVPGITQLDTGDWAHTWFWNFTTHSARRLFDETFGPANVSVEQHGSVLSAVAFLEGMAAEELTEAELAVDDPAYPVFIGVRAVKAKS